MNADDFSEEERRVQRVFYPHMTDRVTRLRSGGRLVHYSSAEAAMNIIAGREIWLRNTTCMNDFSEVEHGLASLREAYNSSLGQAWRTWLDEKLAGVCSEAADLFDRYQDALRFGSYVLCLSEHADDEDAMGRLSMWRAYGSQTGVAMVVRPDPFYAVTDVLKTYSSPVLYSSKDQLFHQFREMLDGLEQESELIVALDRSEVLGHLFNVFKWAALSVKHPGFKEEREWRVAHIPALGTSDVVRSDVRSVRGVPQLVYKLPLRTFPDHGFSTAIPDLIDRIIIGPTEYPEALRDAFFELLRLAGVNDPSNRVVVSDIPLR